jgi:GDPmannose 4,6-dehydratase
MSKKIALITGITGQDGAYLAKLLIKKNYIVHGIKRRTSLINTKRIDDIYENGKLNKKNFFLHYGDVSDGSNINNLISKIRPNEIYNLAAQSHVQVSFQTPFYTTLTNAIGTLNILESIKSCNLINKTKFYQASTSEMFGNINSKKINERDRFEPLSPYASSKLYSYWLTRNYRDSYKIFASNGILFNHESPLRGETFVSRKVTMNVAKRFLGKKEILYLGNIYSKRDWGHAKDYVEAMWKILQSKKADDFVIATNNTFTVKQLVNEAFKNIKVKIKWIGKGLKETGINEKTKEVLIKIDKKYFRPNELDYLRGDYSKAKKILNWKPKITFKNLVKEMVEEDIKNLKNGN